jgi:hypothetical protein
MSNAPVVATTPAQFAQLLAQGVNATYTPPSGMSENAATASIQNAMNSTQGLQLVTPPNNPSTSTAGSPIQSQGVFSTLTALAAQALSTQITGSPTAGAVTAAATTTGTTAPITSWISSHAGNYGLVVMGALLALGALLISQRGNIEKVVETAGKVVAV